VTTTNAWERTVCRQRNHDTRRPTVRYEIRVEPDVDRTWSAWFDGMEVRSLSDGETLIAGEVADQAALHGVLDRVRDLGLGVISVTRVDHP
jgi:hypothetical protein